MMDFAFLEKHFVLVFMTIKESQEIVDHWIKTIGVRYFSELTNTTILMEEVGEVARIVSREYGSNRGKRMQKRVIWVMKWQMSFLF